MPHTIHRPPLMIAIASHKGGAGRTTLALNLAASWSETGNRTVVVDLDPLQGASVWALHTDLSTPAFNPVSMVLAGLTDGEEEGMSPVADILHQTRANDAACVIVDLPACPDFRSRAVLRAADFVLIPTSGNALEFDLTVNTMRHIRELEPDFADTPMALVPLMETGQVLPPALCALGLPFTPVIHRVPELAQGLAHPASKAAAEIEMVADYVAGRLALLLTPERAVA